MKNIKLPSNLELQLNNFLLMQMYHCQSHHNEKKLKENVKLNFQWLKKFCILHYQSRIQRAKELTAPQVTQAKELTQKYIGIKNHDFFVTCVDGRNMPTVMFSKPPNLSGVLRTPAGNVNGFMEGQKKDEVFIDTKSYIVKQIISLLRKKVDDTIYYGLDSHLGCAARGQIHTTEGGHQNDSGIRSDILNKIIIAQGILQLRQKLVDSGEQVAEIIPIFFSFDPLTGGVISGLEMHINEKRIAEEGYTNKILDDLASQGKIIRTIDFLKDKKIVALLNKYIKPRRADFRNQYPKSLLSNWIGLTKLYQNGKGNVFFIIYKGLIQAYSLSGWQIGNKDMFWDKKISKQTLRQKAKFLLKNLVTRYSIAGTDTKWPYDSHQEEMIVITEGGYAPFPDLDAFSVFSHDLDDLINNTKLTIDLIRTFRYNGKIKDPVNNCQLTKDRFFSAPVLISNKCVLRNFQQKSWQSIKLLQLDNYFSHIDWNDPKVLNWNHSDIQKFIFNAVKDKDVTIQFGDTLRFIDSVYELFNRMRLMMKDKSFRKMILHGNIVILNTLVDHNRMPQYIIPFVI